MISFGIVAVFLLCGCGATSPSTVTATPSQTALPVEEYNTQSQVTPTPSASPTATVNPQPTMDNTQPSNSTDNSIQPSAEINNNIVGEDSLSTLENYDLADYEDKIIDLTERMKTADMNAYKPLKKEARQLNDELDIIDDLAEIDYYNEKISSTDYIQLERQLDILEELIDRAEDNMEFRLGIDD